MVAAGQREQRDTQETGCWCNTSESALVTFSRSDSALLLLINDNNVCDAQFVPIGDT